jgi:hypothetical protein
MSEIIVLRTHFYDGFVDRMLRGLATATHRRVVTVVDERAGAVDMPDDIPKIVLNPADIGLVTPPDYGWRCGDYALYEVARAVPEASAYWMIEPDVRIHSANTKAFFDGSQATENADFITAWFAPAGPRWQWHATMAPFAERQYHSMMQLCRFSPSAARLLLRERRGLSARFLSEGRALASWPNDEAFVGATLMDFGFNVATFRDHAPGFHTEGSFTFTRPTSARWLETVPPDNRIFHPVVRGQKFRERLAAYLKDGQGPRGEPMQIEPDLQKQLDVESAPEETVPSVRSAPAVAGGITHRQALPATDSVRGRAVPIRFWNRLRNNGDALTSMLVGRIFGGKPFQAKANEPHVLGVGSILFMANRHSVVWGSGVLNKIAYLPPIEGHQLRALRGKHSADFLMQQGIALGEIAFGDPGILVDSLLPEPLKAAPAKYRYAVIAHHDSTSHPFFAAMRKRDDVCLVNILDDSLLPIEQIAQSEIVLSQSLHGLVYAESFGKPSLWIGTRSDEVWNFKFNDWFSMTANPQDSPAPLEQGLERLASMAEIRVSTIDRVALLDSFPRGLFLETDHRKLDYVSCRALAPAMVFIPKAYEAKADFVSERDGNLLSALSANLVSVASALFEQWAERTYCIAAMVGCAVPTPDQSRVIVAAMDARNSVDFGFIVPRLMKLPEGVVTIELGVGVAIYRNYKALGGVVCLRPSFEGLGENFVVFGI